MKYLVLILVIAAALRLYRLAEPPTYYFDEVYHAVTAKLYARNNPSGYEWWHPAPEPETAIEWLHPPIAKLTQAAGILIFGENAFGWRISSVVFGLAGIVATYFLALQLFKEKRIAFLSALLVSIDGLLFVQSRIAMNDIHVVFFILLALLCYAKFHEAKKDKVERKYLLLTGISAGLAIATKWSGVFLLPIFFGDQLLGWIKSWKFPTYASMIRIFFAWICIPASIYILSYGQFWLQGHTIDQFVELHQQIWNYQTTLVAEHQYQSKPFQWVFDLHPVWLYVNYAGPNMVGNIYNLGNPIVMIAGLCALLFLFAKTVHKFSWNTWFLFWSYICVWFAWNFSPRIMFFYHYAPAIPFLSIGLAIMLHQWLGSKKKISKYFAYATIFLAFVWFIVFYPNLTGIPVPTAFADKVYFLVPGWR